MVTGKSVGGYNTSTIKIYQSKINLNCLKETVIITFYGVASAI